MSRPSFETTMMRVAYDLSLRSTCSRRQVGSVLVNKHGHILSTGYNGVVSGTDHCIDNPCKGSSLPSGEGLEKCEAVHAEQNALLQCPNVMEIHTVFCTTIPCMHCMKLLKNTPAACIYYDQGYSGEKDLISYWSKADGHMRIIRNIKDLEPDVLFRRFPGHDR